MLLVFINELNQEDFANLNYALLLSWVILYNNYTCVNI